MRRSLWFWPVAIACAMVFGLVSALLGDGIWDVASWFALGAPLVFAWFAMRRRQAPT